MRICRQSVALLLMLACIQRASAVVSVTVSGGDVQPNGVGALDVSIDGAGDLINLFGVELLIEPIGGATSTLRFLEEDEAYLSDTSYLFTGNSSAADDGISSSVGTVTTTTVPNDTFLGGDSTADFADVAVSASRLLLRIPIQHDAGPADPATTIGQEFAVRIVPASGDSSELLLGTSDTGFLDSTFTPVPYGSSSGSVTVVPEPSTLLIAVGGLLLPLRRRR